MFTIGFLIFLCWEKVANSCLFRATDLKIEFFAPLSFELFMWNCKLICQSLILGLTWEICITVYSVYGPWLILGFALSVQVMRILCVCRRFKYVSLVIRSPKSMSPLVPETQVYEVEQNVLCLLNLPVINLLDDAFLHYTMT